MSKTYVDYEEVSERDIPISKNKSQGLKKIMIDKIKDNLSKAINISELDIVDESPNHGGYDGSVSHVKIIIVSDDFKENRLLDRHKIVYGHSGV